jgi:hypothetical protein
MLLAGQPLPALLLVPERNSGRLLWLTRPMPAAAAAAAAADVAASSPLDSLMLQLPASCC